MKYNAGTMNNVCYKMQTNTCDSCHHIQLRESAGYQCTGMNPGCDLTRFAVRSCAPPIHPRLPAQFAGETKPDVTSFASEQDMKKQPCT